MIALLSSFPAVYLTKLMNCLLFLAASLSLAPPPGLEWVLAEASLCSDYIPAHE